MGAESGWGGTKDLKRACEFYTKAAEQGNPVGQVRGAHWRGPTRVLAGQLAFGCGGGVRSVSRCISTRWRWSHWAVPFPRLGAVAAVQAEIRLHPTSSALSASSRASTNAAMGQTMSLAC